MKKTLEEVKQYFVEHGCELLESEYINAHAKMKYQCCCGNISFINFNNFRSGKRCGCGRIGLKRLTEYELELEVSARGFKYLSSNFDGNHHIITCLCRCGTERICQLHTLRRTNGCKKCRDQQAAFKYQDIANFFIEQGCLLLDKEYKNARSKLKYRCACGTESEIIFDSFKRGNRCEKCGNAKKSQYMQIGRLGSNHPNWIEDRQKKKENDSFCSRCRTMLKSALKSCGIKKNKRTEELLGYEIVDLKSHLESFPTWNLLKGQAWHIDHLFPIKAFIDYGIKDMKIINCLENLQPLTGTENCVKNAKYDAVAFEVWLKSKNVVILLG